MTRFFYTISVLLAVVCFTGTAAAETDEQAAQRQRRQAAEAMQNTGVFARVPCAACNIPRHFEAYTRKRMRVAL